MFLTVCGKMLDASSDISALYALDQRCGKLTCQVWVFAEIFKITAADGGTFDIYRRTKDHAQILVLAGVTDAFADFSQHFPVKAGRRRAGRRETNCLDTVVYPQVISALVLLAQSMRAVAEHRAGDP